LLSSNSRRAIPRVLDLELLWPLRARFSRPTKPLALSSSTMLEAMSPQPSLAALPRQPAPSSNPITSRALLWSSYLPAMSRQHSSVLRVLARPRFHRQALSLARSSSMFPQATLPAHNTVLLHRSLLPASFHSLMVHLEQSSLSCLPAMSRQHSLVPRALRRPLFHRLAQSLAQSS